MRLAQNANIPMAHHQNGQLELEQIFVKTVNLSCTKMPYNKAVKHRQQAGWTSLRSAAYGKRYGLKGIS